MKNTKKLYALFVGVNAYRSSPLEGCINDVLAVSNYFERLCRAQSRESGMTIAPVFKYLLAPLDKEERHKLATKGLVEYGAPTRQNIIEAFESHLSQADPLNGDFCLLYYSGHGSIMEAPDAFSMVEPTGLFQTLTLIDSREEGKRDLIDKELGFLIAKTMDGKTPDPEKGIPGVQFLTIMDCCHSGSNTREDEPDSASRRMRAGPGVQQGLEMLGFDPAGNCFYEKMIEVNGKWKVPRGGIKHGRHISMAAARDAETAKEKAVYVEEKEVDGQVIRKKQRHGVFTYSLLRTLEEGGVHISYGELIRRIQMEVRSRTENQIPVLGKTVEEEEDLFFFNNQFKTPSKEYEVGFRDGNWYLNAGAIHGIVPPAGDAMTTVAIRARRKGEEDESPPRIVAVEKVLATESILESTPFTEADKDLLLAAVIHEMAFPGVLVGFDEKLPDSMKKAVEAVFEENKPPYVSPAGPGQTPDHIIKLFVDREGERCFSLTRPGSDIPLFAERPSAASFMNDVSKVGKWDSVLKMDNSDAEAVKEHLDHIQVEIRILEGYPFDGRTFNQIPDADYRRREMNPKSISAAYQKVNSGAGSRYVQPAIRTKISNISANGDAYWVGALYLSSRFGISHRYADVQRLSEDESNTFLELKYKDPNGKSYEGIPLELEEGYHRLGISEITDYIVIFVSNRSFDLAQYYQDPLPLTTVRGAGFGAAADDGAVEKDFWFTIKIPVHIRYPIDQKRLPADGKINLGALTVEGAPGFTALIQPTTRAAARNRLRNQEEKTRAPLPEKAFIPPGHLWMHTETSEAIFSRGMSGARPDDYVNLLELTGVQGEVTEDRPLTIIPHTPLLPSESIVAFAYDPEDDLYYPVGYTDASGRIKIIRLPSYTPGIIGGLGDEELTADTERDVKGSMKLFFHKVVWSRLSGRKDYNTLTLFARKAGGSLERWEYKEGPVESYLQSREKIRQQLGAGSGDVLLLVHGWVGDGESMAEAIFHKTELYRLFDAVLNFAYENLNTPIDDIARKLMEMLRACGLENRRLVVLSHSMGGLVSRSFIEHAGGEKFVKRLIQVGSPNGGAVIADTRKRLFNSLVRSMNGAGELEPYSTLASFIFKGVDGRPFVTADEMQTKSEFIRRLNAPDKQPPRAPYDLIAGHLKEEEPETEKQKSRLGKAWDDLRRRGKYELFDLAFFREAPNDWIVRVDSMKTVPWGHTRVEYIYCDHFSYFKTEEGLAALVRMFS